MMTAVYIATPIALWLVANTSPLAAESGAVQIATSTNAVVRARSYEVLIRRIDHFVDRKRRESIVRALQAHRTRILASTNDAQWLEAVNTVLRETSHDRHLQVVFAPTASPGSAPAVDDHGIAASVLRPDGIAILRLSGFRQDEASALAIDHVAARLASARALILDLRENGGGGEVSYARLLGHMFRKRTELNGIAWRTCQRRPGLRPDACEQGPLRIERRFTDAPMHPAFADMAIYVLVSPRTFSAAEAVAYELQQRGRATIIGEATGGGASPSAGMDLESDFAVIMPIGRLHRVTQGVGWEGSGVQPDIVVPSAAAEDRALALIQEVAPQP